MITRMEPIVDGHTEGEKGQGFGQVVRWVSDAISGSRTTFARAICLMDEGTCVPEEIGMAITSPADRKTSYVHWSPMYVRRLAVRLSPAAEQRGNQGT